MKDKSKIHLLIFPNDIADTPATIEAAKPLKIAEEVDILSIAACII